MIYILNLPEKCYASRVFSAREIWQLWLTLPSMDIVGWNNLICPNKAMLVHIHFSKE